MSEELRVDSSIGFKFIRNIVFKDMDGDGWIITEYDRRLWKLKGYGYVVKDMISWDGWE